MLSTNAVWRVAYIKLLIIIIYRFLYVFVCLFLMA